MTDNIDLFIDNLKRHLEILDAEIGDITVKINTSNIKDEQGLYDRSDYYIGAGFVAVQKYLNETF